MTTLSIKSIGFCVNYTPQGDRAFALALDLARRNHLQLNIFHFLHDPYDAASPRDPLTGKEREQRLIELERTMRLYYDEMLGDYLDVGFRLCERNERTELHRCLAKREFQLLVMAYPNEDACFGNQPLLTFVSSFVCPVIVVGPTPDGVGFNTPARLVVDGLFDEDSVALREIPQRALAD